MKILKLDEFLLYESDDKEEEGEELDTFRKPTILSWIKYYFSSKKKIKSKLDRYYKLFVSIAKAEAKKQEEIIKRGNPQNQQALNNEIADLKDSLTSIEQELEYDIEQTKLPKKYKDKLKTLKDQEFLRSRVAYRSLKLSYSKAQRSKQEIADSERLIKKQQEQAIQKSKQIQSFEKDLIDKAKKEQSENKK